MVRIPVYSRRDTKIYYFFIIYCLSFKMNTIKIFCFAFLLVLVCVIFEPIESRSVPNNFHSDVIVTHWPTPSSANGKGVKEEATEPGFMVSTPLLHNAKIKVIVWKIRQNLPTLLFIFSASS